MTQYLAAIYRLENYDPAVSEDEAMGREIDALNDEMKAAGVRAFVGGLIYNVGLLIGTRGADKRRGGGETCHFSAI